jgi:hypothetical protein
MSRIGAGLVDGGVGEHDNLLTGVDKRAKSGTDNDDNQLETHLGLHFPHSLFFSRRCHSPRDPEDVIPCRNLSFSKA